MLSTAFFQRNQLIEVHDAIAWCVTHHRCLLCLTGEFGYWLFIFSLCEPNNIDFNRCTDTRFFASSPVMYLNVSTSWRSFSKSSGSRAEVPAFWRSDSISASVISMR